MGAYYCIAIVSSYRGETLELLHVQRTDMGAYYCIASNGVPPTVSRRYHVEVHSLVGDKIMENPKLRTDETIVNDYSRWMNLTIKSLSLGDYGT
ncbi:unnamed protein product [Chilo suppressalis]|uniref:Immunoglobulin I-set domain-containing protein n=1 Tax=Chilo suppressalis TaxID=168631 RepID=A0ABN8AVE3_CHISP|nr:unnamed protein product [Chilo suppressalis]